MNGTKGRSRRVSREVGSLLIILAAFTFIGCGGGAVQRAFSKEERCKLLIEWAGRFEREYPKAFVTSDRWGKRYNPNAGFNDKILNLYRDEYFVPVFGSRYDDLKQDERAKLYRTVVSPCQGLGYPEMRTYEALIHGLGLTGGVATPEQIERSVISDRLRAQWKDRAMTDLKALPPSDESYAKLEEWAKAGTRDLADFYPSEQKAFFAALDDGRKRIGAAALTARMDKALAEPPSYQNLIMLEKLVNRSTELYAAVPDAVGATLRERGRAALHERLKTVWEQERVRFDARGEGLPGLEQGAALYAEFDKRYLQVFEENPVLQDMDAYMRSGRSRDLGRAQGVLTAEINHAKSAAEITALQKRYLPLDIDGTHRQKLESSVIARNESLKFEGERWKFSDRERALMTKPFQIDVPSSYDPPTGEEIRLAIIRAYVENGGQWIDRTSFKPRLGGIIKLSLVPFTIESVELIGCSAPSSSGYRCRYRPDLRMEVPQGIGATDPAGTIFLDAARRMQQLEQRPIDEEQFVLTSKGWRSGSLVEKVEARTSPWDVFGK